MGGFWQGQKTGSWQMAVISERRRSLLRSSSFAGQAATCQSGESSPQSKTFVPLSSPVFAYSFVVSRETVVAVVAVVSTSVLSVSFYAFFAFSIVIGVRL